MSADNLHDCAHCGGTGTCKSGKDAESCRACVKRNELRKGTYFGLMCGTCGGLGRTDTYTYRLQHRTQPLLSLLIVGGAFAVITLLGLTRSEYFHEVLAFCTTLVGGVTVYYFSRCRDVQ